MILSSVMSFQYFQVLKVIVRNLKSSRLACRYRDIGGIEVVDYVVLNVFTNQDCKWWSNLIGTGPVDDLKCLIETRLS